MHKSFIEKIIKYYEKIFQKATKINEEVFHLFRKENVNSHKVIYRCNAIPIKSPWDFFPRTWWNESEIYDQEYFWKIKRNEGAFSAR